MKLCFFDDYKLGGVKGDRVVDLSAAVADIPRTHPQDVLVGVINSFAQRKAKLEAAIAAGEGVPLASVRLRPPVPRR